MPLIRCSKRFHKEVMKEWRKRKKKDLVATILDEWLHKKELYEKEEAERQKRIAKARDEIRKETARQQAYEIATRK